MFRRRLRGAWRPGVDAEPLEPWDRDAHPEATRLLEGSIVLGTASEPIFNQPSELMEHYVEAFEKVLGGIGAVLSADYRPVQPWPPWPEL